MHPEALTRTNGPENGPLILAGLAAGTQHGAYPVRLGTVHQWHRAGLVKLDASSWRLTRETANFPSSCTRASIVLTRVAAGCACEGRETREALSCGGSLHVRHICGRGCSASIPDMRPEN